MPITDAQVEAAARRIARCCKYDPDAPSDGPGYEVPVWMHFREQARELLDAADRAAWSTDMDAAPPLERVLVSWIETFVSGISHNEQSYRRWEEGAADVNGRLIDHPTADMWRPLPLPPETTDE